MRAQSEVRFTPELLIEAPRRSPAVPSPSGDYAFYTWSAYSLDSHSATSEIRILNLKTEETTLFTDDPANTSLQWLSRDQIIWLRSAGGSTDLWIGNATGDKLPYRAGTINWTLKSLKVKELPDGSIALAFSALQNEDGTLYNPERAAKPKSTGREYESILVCYWDSFVPKERSTLFYTTLQKTPSGKYKLSEKLVNALQSTDIEFPGSPTDNFGRSGSLDLSDSGILFVTFDPVLDVSKVQALRLWHLSVSNFTNAPDRLIKIEVPGYNGNFSSPAFSSDGKLAAFLSTKNFKDETDYNHIFVLRTSADRVFEIAPLGSPTSPAWDISPSSIVWSRDGREIYVSGKQRAREKFWRLHATNPDEQPTTRPIPRELDPKAPGAVIGVSPLGKDPEDPRLLVNWSSYTDSGSFYILNLDNSEQKVTADVRANHLKLGLDPSQISEITFRGASYEIQAWIMHPSNFSPAESYPLMLMVHGGPKSSWSDRWTTIFNPGLWAEQGYVVVLPNPTGSDSFGQAFSAAVQGDWGGKAYADLVKCMEYIETHIPYIDTSRAIAAGPSYGGYMMNYIAGQPLAKKFRTLISHAGIFSMISMLASDAPGNVLGSFGAVPWSGSSPDPALNHWDVFDPARYTHNWTQPMLIIHNERDLLVPISQGLAAYSLCQMKGIPSRFLSFPDESHGVSKPENVYHWYKTILGWSNRYAGVEGGLELEEPVTRRANRGGGV